MSVSVNYNMGTVQQQLSNKLNKLNATGGGYIPVTDSSGEGLSASNYLINDIAKKLNQVIDLESTSKTITLVPNTCYSFGTLDSLDITFPSNGNVGDIIIIDFVSGEVATTLTKDIINAIYNFNTVSSQRFIELKAQYNIVMQRWAVYLSEISYVEYIRKLATPTNLAYDSANSKFTWDAVANASGYGLKINGVETIVYFNSKAYLTDKSVFAIVKSVGNNITYSDSDYSAEKIYNSAIWMPFDNQYYETTITQATYGGGYWYGSAEPTVEYVSSGVVGADGGDAIKITLHKGDNGASLAIRTVLSAASQSGTFIMKCKGLGLSGIGVNNAAVGSDVQYCYYTEVEDGWYYLEIPSWLVTVGNVNTIEFPYAWSLSDNGEIWIDWIAAR